ncbi:hypothetical protein AK95_03245 [Paenibacillus sp. LC231]|uniref:Uncharacterized protein n=1 Tax=Paenibacillus glucanolyticus TaxID=59843 RepID=A0A168EXZ1_9BACL|nr:MULTISPECIES: hypothetical protein [Paenibacillus]KZS44927.1 hypothetical protein AWU65_02780 [Paenibacillus glucanolyticus]OIB01931.1 hypothetical protein AK95_03245 [Paenibacillus sp. LC231]OMF65517.1 hypothetical protein BK142_30690 [Paenibacillus glucanolyticus]
MKYVDRFQSFISKGHYHRMIESEKKLSCLRENIREYQTSTGEKRLEWTELGVVGFFQGIRVFEDDIEALKDHLLQLGVLPVVTKIDLESLPVDLQESMKSWTIPKRPTIRFSPNKTVRIDPTRLHGYREWVGNMDVNDQVKAWTHEKDKYEVLSNEWMHLKRLLVIDIKPLQRFKLSCGSVACVPSKREVLGVDVFQHIGTEALMTFGRVDMKKVMLYTGRGILKKSDVDTYRKVVDVNLRYTLMQTRKEELRNQYYHEYLMNL